MEWIGKVVQDICSCNAKNTLISVVKKIVTFGEIMMRLTTPGFRRFEQAENFSAVFGGGEANVSAALARMGLPSAHVTCFPDNDLGRAAAAFFQKAGVDMAHTIFRGERLGLYFMETGAAMRASKIIYDRFGSAFAKLEPEWFSWASIFEQAQWFHWTGITPAISATAAEACLQAVKTARQLGLTVSADVNYRRNLWQYGKTVAEVMPDLVAQCDIVVCTEGDAADIFGIETGDFSSMATALMQRFPNLKKVIATRRTTLSASHNRLTGICFDGSNYIESPTLDINPIVDRIGGGDAFMAGFIYGALHYEDVASALHFATAASALKHTIEGDFNLVRVHEVEQVMEGDVSGRLLR